MIAIVRDFDQYVSSTNLSVRAVLERLNKTLELFQLIVEADKILVGTVTDGDIRRGLLGGLNLNSPISMVMQRNFLAASESELSSFENSFSTSSAPVTFLPILNERGEISGIMVRKQAAKSIEHALVMAGGFGRRLGERTLNTPKPLLHVGGRPILDHVIENLERTGVATIFVSVHFMADQIIEHLSARTTAVEIRVIHEDEPLGTAGAIGKITETLSSPLLVINGDVITNVDCVAMHDFQLRHGLDGTIGVTRYDVDIPFGVVRYAEDGTFAGIQEKPRISEFVAAGLYYLSPEFLALVPRDRRMDMPELLNTGKEIGLRAGLFPIHEYWTDVGRPADLAAADTHHQAGDPE